MTVAQLLEILKMVPQDYELEILNHHRSISFVDEVTVFGPECCTEPDDRPVVVLHTETRASK